MEEMNITPEQFEMACMEGKNLKALVKDDTDGDNHSFSFHRGLFQQIWAANDIRIFVNLMVKRNVEIQLQALDLIEKRQIASRGSESSDISEFDIDREEIEKVFEAEINENKQSSEEEAVNDKFKRLNLFFEKENHDSADVNQRKEYFYSQRDKILKARSEIRGRRLLDSLKQQETTSENGRPTSSRAAQRVINGENDFDAPEIAVQLRKTLAKKLRTEVVDKADN
jgi:The ARF-like 2 binding protein BART